MVTFLQPHVFCCMRADLASMWSPTNKTGSLRRLSAKTSNMEQQNGKNSISEYEKSADVDDSDLNMEVNIFCICIFISLICI